MSGGVSYLIDPNAATLMLAVIGSLIFILGLVGPKLPFAQHLPYVVILLAVGALTLGLSGLLELPAALSSSNVSALGLVMRLVAGALGGLLFVVAVYTSRRTHGEV
jgi:hypothetical protein